MQIDKWLERAILALVLGAIGYGVLALGAVRPADTVILWWLVLGAAALWAVRIWAAPKFRFLWTPVCWAALPFVAYAAWRYATADVEFLARMEFLEVALAALLLLIVVNNLYSQESTRAFCVAIIVLATGVAMFGIYQWLRTSNNVWGLPRPLAYLGRASGTYISPNHFAGLLELVLPLSVALTVLGRMKALPRVFVGYASFVMFVGLAASQSRAGWIGAAAAFLLLGLLLIRTRGQRWIALAILACVIVGGWWLYSRSVARRVTHTYLKGHEREVRLRLWSAGLEMWRDHPLWGVGPDHFDYRYRKYREPVDKTQGRPGRLHNDYLNTLVDYGLAGLLLALLPIGVAAWGVVRAWPYVQRAGNDFRDKKSNRAAIVLGAAAGLLALLVHSLFDFNMHIPANAFLIVALLGILNAHLRFATERHWVTARIPLALVSTLLLLGALAWLTPHVLTRTREVVLLRDAAPLPPGHPEKIALLTRAAEIEPKNFETAFTLGENLRSLAWAGADDANTHATNAVKWFERAAALNRWDPTSRIHLGMTLDWLERHDEAEPHFRRAVELDPNHWYARAMMGWHEFQVGRYDSARKWFEQSRGLNYADNTIAQAYIVTLDNLERQPKSELRSIFR